MECFYYDLIAIGIVVLAGIVGLFRGFFATLLSLLGFVGTFILAYFFSDEMLVLLDKLFGLATWLKNTLGDSIGHVVAIIVSLAITYLLIRVLVFIINHTVGKIFKGRLFGKLNSLLGLLLGFLKGVLYVAIILIVVNIVALIPSVKTWVDTNFSQTFIVGNVYNLLGDAIGDYFSGDEPVDEGEGEVETP